jgi:hypothetical protein
LLTILLLISIQLNLSLLLKLHSIILSSIILIIVLSPITLMSFLGLKF